MKCKIMVTVNLGDFVMSFRLIGKDCETLENIAEYRILTVSQIAAMFHKNRQVVRRRFRLLFLTNTYGRLAALCKLTHEMFPTKFVWLTECSRLFPEGVSAKIWAVGGDLQPWPA